MKKNLALLVGLTVALSACATPEGEYPSLAVREIERVAGEMEPSAPAFAPPPAPETVDSAEELAELARTAHAGFLEQAEQLRPRISSARGNGRGSENWTRAQVALGALESARSQTLIVLADLDRMFVDAAVEGVAPSSLAEIRDEVAEMVAREDRMISAFAEELAV